MTQPEALRLADKMSSYSLSSGYAWHCHKAAAELRRLHESNKDLLEALKHARHSAHPWDCDISFLDAAIAKAEGGAA
jgi:hypothetical protein